MKVKPILFNSDMVRGVLEGRKTQTRRIIKPQPLFRNDIIYQHDNGKWYISPDNDNFGESEVKPLCDINDILYVRETWRPYKAWSGSFGSGCEIMYATGESRTFDKVIAVPNNKPNIWHPSIHMPKEVSRIFLKVKNVRAERLQDITFEDICAEGIYDDYKTISKEYHDFLASVAYPKCFKELWDSTINPKNLYQYGWSANPYVWVYEFERLNDLQCWSDLETNIKI